MYASSLALFTSIGNFVYLFCISLINGFWVPCVGDDYWHGVCSSRAELTECDGRFLWICICACVGNWNDITWIWLAKIHHHHLLRIILCFWAIRNSGSRVVYWCTIFCYYYIPQGSFIFGLILHMVFSYLFLFNTTAYGIFGPPYFQCLFMLVVSSMIA